MIRTRFNDGWEFRAKVNPFAELDGTGTPYRPVTLPHDAVRDLDRVPGGAGGAGGATDGAAQAYFPGGVFQYRKSFLAGADLADKRVLVEFEGVYRSAMVYVNGEYAGQRPYGYSQFTVDIGPLLALGEDNEILVEARAHEDSRWYTGAGIYRDTWLVTGAATRIAHESLRVTTPDVDERRAVVEVVAAVETDAVRGCTARARIELADATGTVVASAVTPISVLPGEPATLRRRLYVDDPRRWDVNSPHLYTCTVTLADGERELDCEATPFGIRTVQVDPARGLRVNGAEVKLRGACVHHDNGILGAATFSAAEERRVRLLKEAGFNAIRMSHHPAGRTLLDACDRIGMLVLDETFDMWTAGKTGFDYSLDFPEWWERDVAAMVAKDINRPSVIGYSIGNEIPELATKTGAIWSRRLAEKVRELDGTRFVTNAVNPFLTVMDELRRRREEGLTEDTERGINTFMADPGVSMNAIGTSDLVTERTEESFAVLDVAGMNYLEGRYELDRELFPDRVILGTETFSTHIDGNWKLVKEHSHVIGDFTWTGWEYLGEVGLGRPYYASDGPAGAVPYPYLVSSSADLDLIGRRRPVSYYREIVFGLREAPYISVQRPDRYGDRWLGSPWAWMDGIESWTWPEHDGKPVMVDVYSAADEVELLVNGRSLGRAPAGPEHRFRAHFDTVVEPGTLEAVAYRGGREEGRFALTTASDEVTLTARAEHPEIPVDGSDVGFVTLGLVDRHGVPHTAADRAVRLALEGPATLVGFGTGNPSTPERFDADERMTYEGQALAAIRATGPGRITLTAHAAGCNPVSVQILAH